MRIWPFKKNPPLPIQHLQAVTLRDDDIVIVTAKQVLTDNQKVFLEKGLREVEIRNRLVILDEGLQLGILRRQP